MSYFPFEEYANVHEAGMNGARMDSHEEWDDFDYSMTLPDPNWPTDTFAGDDGVDETIDPALLHQNSASSASSAYETTMQEP